MAVYDALSQANGNGVNFDQWFYASCENPDEAAACFEISKRRKKR
jgi:hypothetical protein